MLTTLAGWPGARWDSGSWAAAAVPGRASRSVLDLGPSSAGAAWPRKGSGTLKRRHRSGEGRHSSTVLRGALGLAACNNGVTCPSMRQSIDSECWNGLPMQLMRAAWPEQVPWAMMSDARYSHDTFSGSIWMRVHQGSYEPQEKSRISAKLYGRDNQSEEGRITRSLYL